MSTRTRATTRTTQPLMSPATTKAPRGITSTTSRTAQQRNDSLALGDSRTYIQSTDQFTTASYTPGSRATSRTRHHQQSRNDTSDEDGDEYSDQEENSIRNSSQLHQHHLSSRLTQTNRLQTPNSTTAQLPRKSTPTYDQSMSTQSQHSKYDSSRQLPPQTPRPPSSTSTTSRSSSSSLASLFSWEQFQKSLNHSYSRPLYGIVLILAVVIAFLFFILFVNRHILAIPVLSPQRIAPHDPLLLSNGQFLTEKDLASLQSRFALRETMEKEHAELKKQNAELMETIKQFKTQLPSQIKSLIETNFSAKLSEKHDIVDFETFRTGLGLEISKIVNDSGNRHLVQSAEFHQHVEVVEGQIRALSDTQAAIVKDLKQLADSSPAPQQANASSTNHTQIEVLINDVKFIQSVSQQVATQIEKLKTQIKQTPDPKFDEFSTKLAQLEAQLKEMTIGDEKGLSEFGKLLESVRVAQEEHAAAFQVFSTVNNDQTHHSALSRAVKEWIDGMNSNQKQVVVQMETFKQQVQERSDQIQQTSDQIQAQNDKIQAQNVQIQAQSAKIQLRLDSTKNLNDRYINRDDFHQYLQLYLNADRTGMIDYAHESYETRISAHSPEHSSSASSLIPFVNLYKTQSLYANAQVPQVHTVLNEIRGIGDHFKMAGTSGYIIIAFAKPILITHISLEHIVSAADRDHTATPKGFRLYGINPSEDREELLLKSYFKKPHIPSHIALNDPSIPRLQDQSATQAPFNDEFVSSIQTFPIVEESAQSKPYHSIKFEVYTNYGHKDFTKIYRVRVHGMPQSENL